MNSLEKEFEDTDWLKLINRIRLFIDDYNLDLISIDLKKTNTSYKAKIKYGLGLR